MQLQVNDFVKQTTRVKLKKIKLIQIVSLSNF